MDNFGDFLGPSFGGLAQPSKTKKTEKGLPWEAKNIDGKLYLPLHQVIELLKQNEVLPAVRRGLEKHL